MAVAVDSAAGTEETARSAEQDLLSHPFADALPAMSENEYIELLADIRTHGQRQPVLLFDGMILDGRHRARACAALGMTPLTTAFSGTPEEAMAEVVSLNVHRRHLTFEQKRALITGELQRDPTQSDRGIAAKARVDHKTVAAARLASEATGEIPQSELRVGVNGVAKPRQPRRVRSHTAQIARATVYAVAGVCQGISIIQDLGLQIEVKEAAELSKTLREAMPLITWFQNELRKTATSIADETPTTSSVVSHACGEDAARELTTSAVAT